ncbi:hypothetical protein TKWG_13925 [Advenella kashmirensis WT001]|uniref:Uncharacterized protein n=1 Tax=Advenella kashmirensis (strain DSM 17095 / LMG 22695 / WT001) TaxID=1036672 RepID=I3UCX9_ADVKW|nr:hypothetical protein TKWG_13925 [Advenella kashmirensis WT001]
MIDGLIAGRLYGSAKQGTGKTGDTYTTAKVKATAGNGETCCAVSLPLRIKPRPRYWR